MKKSKTLVIFLGIIVVILFTGCATTPSVQIWQPWTRILESNATIPQKSKIKITVEGTTYPLLGNNVLLQKEIKQKMIYLLERRGYKIVNNDFDFSLNLAYKTDRFDKVTSSSLMYSSTDNASVLLSTSGSLTSLGLGVSIAQTISALSNKSSVISQNISETVKSYTHTISIEIENTSKELIWQGESTWDSPNINLQTDITSAIQLIVSNLPDSKENLPMVSTIKKGKENNYFNLICKDKWFSCPALPYKITFSPVVSSSSASIDYSIPSSINNPSVLAAYVDLLQTAEYVLPLGIKKNPLNRSLWSKIQLGSIYKLTNDKQIRILIILNGEKNGYVVNKCWIATDEEFTEFEKKLSNWRDALIDYYDVYED